jgi:hypothetical protein
MSKRSQTLGTTIVQCRPNMSTDVQRRQGAGPMGDGQCPRTDDLVVRLAGRFGCQAWQVDHNRRWTTAADGRAILLKSSEVDRSHEYHGGIKKEDGLKVAKLRLRIICSVIRSVSREVHRTRRWYF